MGVACVLLSVLLSASRGTAYAGAPTRPAAIQTLVPAPFLERMLLSPSRPIRVTVRVVSPGGERRSRVGLRATAEPPAVVEPAEAVTDAQGRAEFDVSLDLSASRPRDTDFARVLVEAVGTLGAERRIAPVVFALRIPETGLSGIWSGSAEPPAGASPGRTAYGRRPAGGSSGRDGPSAAETPAPSASDAASPPAPEAPPSGSFLGGFLARFRRAPRPPEEAGADAIASITVMSREATRRWSPKEAAASEPLTFRPGEAVLVTVSLAPAVPAGRPSVEVSIDGGRTWRRAAASTPPEHILFFTAERGERYRISARVAGD